MAATKLLLITTGGTIAGNVAAERIKSKEDRYQMNFENIIKPTIEAIRKNWAIEITVDTAELFDYDSSDIKPEHWKAMCQTIQDNYDEYDGFVITHGTNTLGYTSSALSFALENLNKPVILTGSQIPNGKPGSDALMNLENALRISVWPYHQLKGVIVVYGSRIITGTRVKKSTEFDYDAFRSFSFAEIGMIGRVISINEENLQKHNDYLARRSQKRIAIRADQLVVSSEFDMRIASLTEFPGMLLDIFKKLVEEVEIKVFIFRAFGAGDPCQDLFEAFRYLKSQKIPIVITTQAPDGNSNFQVNESGQKLAQESLAIPAFDMSIESITTKLGWLLAQSTPYESMKSEMHKDLHGEINVINDMR